LRGLSHRRPGRYFDLPVGWQELDRVFGR
jgi:hypothetical protein